MAKRFDSDTVRGTPIELEIDGKSVIARAGETIASLLLLEGNHCCYRTQSGEPRMMFCNMGTCFECRVHVAEASGSHWVLACKTAVREGLSIRTGITSSQWPEGVSNGN